MVRMIFVRFATFSATRFFDTFWSPLGSLLAPLGLQVAHFWLPYGSLWLPFDSFGSLLVLFGSLWLTFGNLFEEIMKTFMNSIHFHEFARLVYIVLRISIFFATPLLKNIYFHKHPLPPWHGTKPCRRQPR